MSTLRRILQSVMGIKLLPRDDLTPSPPLDYTRADMDAALKAIVVPHLRTMGFKGSLPHFHRPRGEAVDLLSFQFSQYGGKFVVELGRMVPEGFDFHGKHIPPVKAAASFLKERHRLGSPLKPNYGDYWFDYTRGVPDELAREVCDLLDREELWAFVDSLATLGETVD